MNAMKAYDYALNVLKAPFPLGEIAIATDALYSYLYALTILKAAFPEGEKAIATSSSNEKYRKLFPI